MPASRETPLTQAYLYHRQAEPRRTATAALAMARRDVANSVRRYARRPSRCFAGSWQRLEDMPHHASADSRAYYCDNWPEGWRDQGDAHKNVQRIDHTGWYCDDFQSNLYVGRVLQLPARDRKPVYVPGIYQTDSDGVTLFPLDTYDSAADCAYAADRYAERYAELAREYNEAWQRGAEYERLTDEIADLRKEALGLLGDLRTAHRALPPEIIDDGTLTRLCGRLRSDVESILREFTKLRTRRDRLADDIPSRLMDAFVDGGGRKPA